MRFTFGWFNACCLRIKLCLDLYNGILSTILYFTTSTPPEKENETVTEVMNGLIVTRPAKKIESLYKAKETQASEPIITDLQKSKQDLNQLSMKL